MTKMPSVGEVLLRKATLDDSYRILEWRNDPDAIQMSATRKPVTKQEHDLWYIMALSGQNTFLYVAETDVRTEAWQPVNIQPIGCGRIAVDAAVAIISYSVDRQYRGVGYAGQIVGLLCMEAYQLGFKSIQASVRRSNTRSIKALMRNDFILTESELLRFEKERL